MFSDIRSAGLWIGLRFLKLVKSSDFIQAAYNEGLIVVQAAVSEKTIRLAPSLIISGQKKSTKASRDSKKHIKISS